MANARAPGQGIALTLLVLACAAPVLWLATAYATKAGVLTYELGYDLVARRLLFGLAGVGAVAAVALVGLAVLRRRFVALALAAVLVAVGTLAGFVSQARQLATSRGEDVSTDLAEIPGFGVLARERAGQGPDRTVGTEACAAALPAMTQSLPEAVVYELQKRGVTVRRAGVTGVYGVHQSFWFGFAHDVVVRIRPGRTDIRVTARDGRPHGGEACRLVGEISAALKVGERR